MEKAHIDNLKASQTSLPWESAVHAAIFSDTWEPAQMNQLSFAVPPPMGDDGIEEPGQCGFRSCLVSGLMSQSPSNGSC